MSTMITREARRHELAKAAEHYLGMRRELRWAESELEPQFVRLFEATYADGAASGDSKYFVVEIGSNVVGSAVALIRRSMSERYLKTLPSGYIANVFVEPDFRHRGAARALTNAAIEWLRSVGCKVVKLQASRYGRPLYESIGFVATGEMELRL